MAMGYMGFVRFQFLIRKLLELKIKQTKTLRIKQTYVVLEVGIVLTHSLPFLVDMSTLVSDLLHHIAHFVHTRQCRDRHTFG